LTDNTDKVSLAVIIQIDVVYWVVGNSVASMVVAQASEQSSFWPPVSHAN
jgi:hypothetical protein